MKKFYIIAFLCSFITLQAQPKVNIELRKSTVNQRILEVYITPNQNLTDYISAVVFSIRWDKSCGSITLGNTTAPFAALPMSKSGTQHSDATYNYQIFACIGTSFSYIANTPILIMSVPVEGGGSMANCTFEALAVHQDPIFGDGNFYIEFALDGGINNFAGTITNNANIVIPVELMDFKVTKKDKSAQLSWQTATERNTHHFDIERSNDGLAFSKIGEQKAVGGTHTSSYLALDDTPQYGINYYRLKIVDTDDKVVYSKIQSLTFGKGLVVRTFPNPIEGELMIDVSSEGKTVDITVMDLLGKVVFRQNTEGGDLLTIKTTDWQTGVYILTVGDGQKNYQQKIVKQ